MSIKPSRSKKRSVGRPATITTEVVQRVAQRVAKGMPLRYALIKETPAIREDAWHKCLQRKPDLSTLYQKAQADFIEAACDRLVSERDPANLRWILERRHSGHFAKQPDTVVAVSQTVAGVPEDVWKEIQARAAEKAQTNGHKPKAKT